MVDYWRRTIVVHAVCFSYYFDTNSRRDTGVPLIRIRRFNPLYENKVGPGLRYGYKFVHQDAVC